ncbi:MAG: hypothetical protein HOO66_05965 [Nitrosarchaeum sp.]|nr:hypothetical protein [Nitrosarchaeum sp.]
MPSEQVKVISGSECLLSTIPYTTGKFSIGIIHLPYLPNLKSNLLKTCWFLKNNWDKVYFVGKDILETYMNIPSTNYYRQ